MNTRRIWIEIVLVGSAISVGLALLLAGDVRLLFEDHTSRRGPDQLLSNAERSPGENLVVPRVIEIVRSSSTQTGG